jgi:hypothetical protein
LSCVNVETGSNLLKLEHVPVDLVLVDVGALALVLPSVSVSALDLLLLECVLVLAFKSAFNLALVLFDIEGLVEEFMHLVVVFIVQARYFMQGLVVEGHFSHL